MKELHTGNLFWPSTLSSTKQYEPLKQNKKTQVAIIGGGMSGTICGSAFVRSGLSAMVLERGEVAGGSTSANTGLLQFSNDIMLCDLIDQIGEHDAQLFYRSCRDAVDMLADIAEELPADVGFIRRSSLYYASSEQDLPKLRKEYEALKACGLDVEFWSSDEIAAHFPFRKSGAIVTHGDAEVNPYQFVNGLADSAALNGLEIHEHTDVVEHVTLPNGLHRLRTADGFEIEAEHVVYAIGYEPEELRGKLIKAEINRSFALVTHKEPSLQSWHKQFLIWETARPYLYMRTTVDGRVVVGGLDEDNEQPLHSESGRHKRSEKLIQQLRELFPDLTAEIEYEWSATFGESRDGLPFIGADPAWSNVYYCLGYGGNGTVYSVLAAYLLRDLIRGEEQPLTHIVKLDRKSLANV
ncbi:glycine/D-amino acid oxidase-like deaminating enzyme [Paenibacillus castaneae]|uniref:NAD(P)/FAD-dependent oxidoreductase n=1 Tax=Paenibacillus castaneae TaxID=474957 RepID=UPI000C9B3B17|nr:FAD-dependent oxidoreductase [Paenibacillus castaneae]NIK78635.1 glycine/D-amino acid oxidase-like deaminating enzyme [Paenibacillus castaneae]